MGTDAVQDCRVEPDRTPGDESAQLRRGVGDDVAGDPGEDPPNLQ